MTDLTVLDFTEGITCIYEDIGVSEYEDVEEFIERQGHQVKNCEWMTRLTREKTT